MTRFTAHILVSGKPVCVLDKDTRQPREFRSRDEAQYYMECELCFECGEYLILPVEDGDE